VAEARANDVWLRRQIRLSGSSCPNISGRIGPPNLALCASGHPLPRRFRR
jgi:hypothetical protein